MPLINTSLPNLIQGVSQQPDSVRFDGQCEEQENALSDIVDGLVKRPNTRHIGRLLTEALDANSFVHFINRDDDEKYVIIHDGSTLQAWNLDGTQCTINGGSSFDITTTQLATSNPRDVLKSLTIADGTFIVNSEQEVGLGSDYSPDLDKEALVFVKQGDYEKKYTLELEGDFSTGGAAGTTASLNITLSDAGSNKLTVTGVTIANGGTLYEDGSNITIDLPEFLTLGNGPNELTVYADANLSIGTDANGTITSVSIVYGGSYSYHRGTFGNKTYASSATSNNTPASAPTGTAATDVATIEITSGASTNGGSQADTHEILSELHTEFTDVSNFPSGGGDFTTEVSNNLMVITRVSGLTDFKIAGSDGLANTALGVVYKEVGSISDLPTYAKNDFRVKVRGDVELNQDDYYVKFETTDGQTYGEGTWVETLAPSIRLGLDEDTLPMVLLNTNVNTFTIAAMNTQDRTTGDDYTNPLPSFVGQSISNLFFFKNRLGFLSRENIILSESGLGAINASAEVTYNFSRNTVTTLLDSDPIDVAVASSRVTNLKAAKGFQENLVLFSENGQFVLKGGDVLTPKTVSITPVTNFEADDAVDPIPLGAYIYFPFTRSGFSSVREFTLNGTTDVYDSTEVSEHVPRYVPDNLFVFAGSSSEDMLAMVSDNDRSTIYIYKYFFNGNQKVLSSWFKFTVDGDIRGLQFIKSTMYIVLVKNDETQLLEMPMSSGVADAAGYNTYLDQRIEATVLDGQDTITLPYTPEADDEIQVYTKDGLKLNSTRSGSTITLSQTVVGDTEVFAGYPYLMKYTFSEQIFKASAGNSKSPSSFATMKIRNGVLFYNDSASFKVKVTPKFRDTYENVFTPNVVGSSQLGSLDLDSGAYRFPVFTKAHDTVITIENDTALPSNFTSAEFESFTHSRSQRYAG